jgi:uncharacterized protein (DUF433 family)
MLDEAELSGATRRDRTGDLLITKSSGAQQTSLAGNFYTRCMERSEYIEQRNGGFYVAGARVSLDSIVYSFKAGASPETIRQNFSSLTREQVYGAIAFYLTHEQEVDANIREGETGIERPVPPLSESRPELYARLERARHDISTQDLAKH